MLATAVKLFASTVKREAALVPMFPVSTIKVTFALALMPPATLAFVIPVAERRETLVALIAPPKLNAPPVVRSTALLAVIAPLLVISPAASKSKVPPALVVAEVILTEFNSFK